LQLAAQNDPDSPLHALGVFKLLAMKELLKRHGRAFSRPAALSITDGARLAVCVTVPGQWSLTALFAESGKHFD
jgi:hypothetical protein